jgi:hypothetical protein
VALLSEPLRALVLRLLFCSCCGSMLSLCFSLLLLFLLAHPCASVVCATCAGNACDGSDPSTCPWSAQVQTNAACLLAGTAICLTSLLPMKVLRLFPRSVLEAISALSVRTLVVFDPVGKTITEILDAVKRGRITKDEAITHVAGMGSLLTNAADPAEFRRIEFALKALDACKKSLTDSSSSVEGALLFTLFKLSTAFCSKSSSSVCFDCSSSDGVGDSSLPSTSKSFSAQLVRPPSEGHMGSLLNMFTATCHSMGLSNVLAITTMMEDVIYEPLRSGALDWPVAFECFVIYLRMLEAQGASASYTVVDIFHKAGGIDAVRAEAARIARVHYPAAFFRTHGGNPSGTKPPTTSSKKSQMFGITGVYYK